MESVGGLRAHPRACLISRVSRKTVIAVSLPSSWVRMGEQSRAESKPSDLCIRFQLAKPLHTISHLVWVLQEPSWGWRMLFLSHHEEKWDEEEECPESCWEQKAESRCPDAPARAPTHVRPSFYGSMGKVRGQGAKSPDSWCFGLNFVRPEDRLKS